MFQVTLDIREGSLISQRPDQAIERLGYFIEWTEIHSVEIGSYFQRCLRAITDDGDLVNAIWGLDGVAIDYQLSLSETEIDYQDLEYYDDLED